MPFQNIRFKRTLKNFKNLENELLKFVSNNKTKKRVDKQRNTSSKVEIMREKLLNEWNMHTMMSQIIVHVRLLIQGKLFRPL